jgi:lysophospholipid acyltransferase (LPLAT)-like uncharacterized protein
MTLRRAVAGWTGKWVLNALMRTTRYDVHGREHYLQFYREAKPVIFVLWHSRLLPLSYERRGEGVATLVSASGDGEYIARIVRGWGYEPVRGSSSRQGGQALRQLVRFARAGKSIAITPDGPRGPRQKMKPGVLVAAQLTGLPIIPAAAATQSAWWAGSWDRFLVPKPFARIRIEYGAPLWIPRAAQGAALDEQALRVEHALNDLLEHTEHATARA